MISGFKVGDIMILINKLVVLCKNSEEDIINGISNIIRNKYGEVDLSLMIKIPEDILNFDLKYKNRFDCFIDELYVLKLSTEDQSEEIEEVLNDCKSFMTQEEIEWQEKALDLKLKYGEYEPVKYFRLKSGVSENALPGDAGLPANNKKQFSFYTKDEPPGEWVKLISSYFPTVDFELHYKEKSQLKYKLNKFKGGKKLR